MGQIKNIKLHIVTDIKVTIHRMANFLHVKTLESDEELPEGYDDDDDEDEIEGKLVTGNKKKKLNSDFDGDFKFDTDTKTNPNWSIDESIKSRAKGMLSSELMEDKIKKKRKERAEKKKESD